MIKYHLKQLKRKPRNVEIVFWGADIHHLIMDHFFPDPSPDLLYMLFKETDKSPSKHFVRVSDRQMKNCTWYEIVPDERKSP